MPSPPPSAFLLLLECFLASAAPVSTSIQPATIPGVLLRGNPTINPVPLRPQFRPTASPSDGPAGLYNVTVTSTLTSLHISVYRTLPLDSDALLPLLTRASKSVTRHVSDGGGASYADHWLPPHDDPFVFAHQKSATDERGRRQHLTYRVVRDVIWGLRAFVTGHDDGFYGSSFEVVEGRWGVVGRGLVMPGELMAGGTVDGRFPGEVGWLWGLNMTAVVRVLGQG